MRAVIIPTIALAGLIGLAAPIQATPAAPHDFALTAPAITSSSSAAPKTAPVNEIILRGGEPLLMDSKRGGRTRGEELTYFANDDRLLVNGSNAQPANSTIKASSQKSKK